jgi:hypothetical protein
MDSVGLKIIQALTLICVAALCVSLVLLAIGVGEPPLSGPDQMRANSAKQLMAALEKYRSAKGAYPILGNNRITDLKPALVDGGFLKEIPPDDIPGAQPMRYISHTGASYGILSAKKGKQCLIEVGASDTGWWALTSKDLCFPD